MAKKKLDYASMFTLRKDGRYVATYSDDNGRHHIYDRDPENLYKKLQAATVQKEEHIPTLEEIAEGWERQHRETITDQTWKNYAAHYKSILAKHGSKPVTDISALDVTNHLMQAKAQGYSATVVNTIRSLYRMIFDYAIVNECAQYNPVTAVKLPRGLKRGKRTAPTDTQIKQIFAAADAPFGMFPVFLLCTGCRKSEALALSWDDVDFEGREIKITKSLDYTSGANPKYKPPKTDAGIRTVPIIDILYDMLQQAYIARTSDLVFPAPDSNRGGKGGGLMTLRGYEGHWNKYCEAAGFIGSDGKPTLTAHNLRHGTATLMFELGVDELTAQRILGHSRIEITREIYTELRANQKMKSVDKFNAGMTAYLQTK